MFNTVNEKIKRDDICEMIDEIVYSYYDKNKQYADVIDGNKKLKLIAGYNIILFNYASEISYLIKGDKFTTIHSLTRDFLECYAIIIETIKLYYKEEEYNKFQKELIIKGLNQEVKTTEELEKTYDKACSDNIEYVQNKLKKYFIKEKIGSKILNEDDIKNMKFDQLKEIIEILYKRYTKNKRGTNKFISMQLKQNPFLKEFTTNSAIYRELCNYTHMNPSSIEDRIVIEDKNMGIITNFKPSKNTRFLLTLIYSCIKDVYDKMDKIINK